MPETQSDSEPQLLLKHSSLFEIRNSQSFFNILPPEWTECLQPYWAEYEKSTKIYGLLEDGHLIGGGLIFDRPSPDTPYIQFANRLFEKGYLYIGFLWIEPTHRGKGLGKQWLESVRELYPNNRFWLSIEEENLKPFYDQNGFKLSATLEYDEGCIDWIFIESGR